MAAEIAWRWAAGGAFWALLVLSFVEYASSLKVSNVNSLLWKLGYPPLAAQAFADTIAGSGYKLLAIATVLVPGIAMIWTAAATIGRTATLRAMLSDCTVRFRTILALNFFRAATALAVLIGAAGVFAIAMRLYSDGPGSVPHPERSTWVLLFGWLLLVYLWSVANWFLSLAPVVAVQENCDALVAVSGAVRVFGERKGTFVDVNLAFATLHVLMFLTFTALSFFPLMMMAALPGKLVLVLLALLTMAYFGVTNYLYMARLGAYIALVREQSVE